MYTGERMFELLLITPPGPPAKIAALVRAALHGAPGGRVAVQLRAKQLRAGALLALAQELHELTSAAGAPLLINDRLDVAQLVRAEGVHIPEGGLPPSAARRALEASSRPEPLVGVSCHDRTGLRSAADGGASFATLSPVFASPEKGPPLGLDRFRALTIEAELPVLALGGITADQAAACRDAGASGLAVVTSVFSDPQPAAAVLRILEAWDRGRA